MIASSALRRALAVLTFVTLGVLPMTSAQAAPLSECGWSGRVGADTLNVALPDTFANYWVAAVPALPPEGVTLRGRFPHGRYISFTSYRGAQTFDGLDDLRIAPDPGSVNPFLPGADRTATDRSYTVRVLPGPRPERPEPNTLYADPALAVLIYRVYRPDAGRDALGGEPLPEITVNGAQGSRTLPACPPAASPADPGTVHLPSGPDLPGREGRTWSKTSGNGLFANPDNQYLTSRVAPRAGEVAVVRAKAPATPATVGGESRMGAGEVRYWSLCSNELFSTRVSACVVDDEVPVDADGYFTVVVSDPADRPAHATAECGVAWLPTTRFATLLILRNMLPANDFYHSIQRADADDPAAAMGEYHPRTELGAASDFVAPGCR
ncbi:hypothetical protein IU487_29435 [Nocardia puris]|uniref:DUF1214 domain-containing protein n=1 Tax=Nocardia puris TaxID=208602 RepID=A0A366D0N3_9NOCA|nr:hypothetical protein [Nocardia puris]MBF6215130.1 hypothetical protein [Nocardia puris]RBO83633.1 hypothetical protein DFR74_11857 [Nocardia puris]